MYLQYVLYTFIRALARFSPVDTVEKWRFDRGMWIYAGVIGIPFTARTIHTRNPLSAIAYTILPIAVSLGSLRLKKVVVLSFQ